MRSSSAQRLSVVTRRKDRAARSESSVARSRLERSLDAIKPVIEDLESRTMLDAGLTGHYYANRSLRLEPAATRIDANAGNFNFGNGAPAGITGLDINNYSIA